MVMIWRAASGSAEKRIHARQAQAATGPVEAVCPSASKKRAREKFAAAAPPLVIRME